MARDVTPSRGTFVVIDSEDAAEGKLQVAVLTEKAIQFRAVTPRQN
jgi:hypothetical protein